jgi:hypothetical protein
MLLLVLFGASRGITHISTLMCVRAVMFMFLIPRGLKIMQRVLEGLSQPIRVVPRLWKPRASSLPRALMRYLWCVCVC